MSQTVRDVILRIKTELQGARGGPASGFTNMSKEVKRAEADMQPLRRTIKGATDDLVRMERQAKKTGDALKFSSGRIVPPGSYGGGGGGGQGGGMGGMLGGGGLMGFGLKGLLAAGIMTTVREAVTSAQNQWGASLHGGPLMKGSSPLYEYAHDLLAGTKYREAREDLDEQKFDIALRRREGLFQAGFEGDRARDALALSQIPDWATPRERLAALQKRANWPVKSYQDATMATMRQADALAARQDTTAAEYRRLIGEGRIPGLFGGHGIKHDPSGFYGSKFRDLESQRNSTLDGQLKTGKELLQNLLQESMVRKELTDNLQQQLEVTKKDAKARGDSLTTWGQLDPFQRRSAVGVAVALKEGRPLTMEQRSLGMQVPEIAEYMKRQGASQAVADPQYEQMLRLVGRPGDAERFAQSRDAASKIKLEPGQMRIEAFLRVDEQALASAIAEKLRANIKDVELLVKETARRAADLEQMQLRRAADRKAALGNSAPGQ